VLTPSSAAAALSPLGLVRRRRETVMNRWFAYGGVAASVVLVAYFSIVMGIAMLLTGGGFLVLTLGGALGYAPMRCGEKVETAPVA
jgi:hypothetical protein